MSSVFLSAHPHLQYYCTFVGYPKSGHSLIGSLLDAHPDIVIAHEQDALRCIKLGFPAETIYGLLIDNSQRFARGGRTWNNYVYLVPGQWNGKVRELRVIGDKKGGGTTKLLKRNPQLLDRLMEIIPLQHKFVHVMRNPFDSISTLSKIDLRGQERLIRHFARKWEIISQLKQKLPASDWFDIRHEWFIGDPKRWLKKLCGFLGQETTGNYLEDCNAIVKQVPNKSRLEVRWPLETIRHVEEKMKQYPFLEGYSYES